MIATFEHLSSVIAVMNAVEKKFTIKQLLAKRRKVKQRYRVTPTNGSNWVAYLYLDAHGLKEYNYCNCELIEQNPLFNEITQEIEEIKK